MPQSIYAQNIHKPYLEVLKLEADVDRLYWGAKPLAIETVHVR